MNRVFDGHNLAFSGLCLYDQFEAEFDIVLCAQDAFVHEHLMLDDDIVSILLLNHLSIFVNGQRQFIDFAFKETFIVKGKIDLSLRNLDL